MNPSLNRYSSGFKLLWAMLTKNGINPPEATVDQVVDNLIQLFGVSKHQARNAYSALLLLPGYQSVRFHPLLSPYKKMWNIATEKYACFWDARPVLLKLAETPFSFFDDPSHLVDLRTQLILVARLLCLYRSVDLAQALRTCSVLHSKPFLKIKRKGQRFAKWERVLSVLDFPQISPFHLMQKYVALTRFQGKPGGPLLLTLSPPYKGITADTVASLTRVALGVLTPFHEGSRGGAPEIPGVKRGGSVRSGALEGRRSVRVPLSAPWCAGVSRRAGERYVSAQNLTIHKCGA